MFRITPLTSNNLKEMTHFCKENIIYISNDLLEIQRGIVGIEWSTNAIYDAYQCASEWVTNLDASLYQRTVSSHSIFPPLWNPSYTALEESSWIMEHLYDVLGEFKADPKFYYECFREKKEPEKEHIDKGYYSKSSGKIKRPPQYWCFSYNGKIHSKNEIEDVLADSCYADDTWSVDITYAYLQDEHSNPGNLAYSTCGRLFFTNGATREKLKQIFPDAKIYMGKEASDFYKAHILKYYGPEYRPHVWHYEY